MNNNYIKYKINKLNQIITKNFINKINSKIKIQKKIKISIHNSNQNNRNNKIIIKNSKNKIKIKKFQMMMNNILN